MAVLRLMWWLTNLLTLSVKPWDCISDGGCDWTKTTWVCSTLSQHRWQYCDSLMGMKSSCTMSFQEKNESKPKGQTGGVTFKISRGWVEKINRERKQLQISWFGCVVSHTCFGLFAGCTRRKLQDELQRRDRDAFKTDKGKDAEWSGATSLNVSTRLTVHTAHSHYTAQLCRLCAMEYELAMLRWGSRWSSVAVFRAKEQPVAWPENKEVAADEGLKTE